MASIDRTPTTARDNKNGLPRLYVKLAWQSRNWGLYGNQSKVFLSLDLIEIYLYLLRF